MDKKGVGGVVILLVIGAVAFVIGFHPVYQHNVAVQENQAVDATVISTDIDVDRDDDDTDYRPVVRYEYTVDGQTYTSENVYPGQFTRWHDSRSKAESVIGDYQAGSGTTAGGEQVTAFYNPDNPGDAYLRNDDGWPGGWWIITGYALLAFVGGIYLVRKGFKRWRQRLLIRDTPTELAQSLSVGPSEIKGTAVIDDLTTMSAPFSEEECVVAKYEVEEYYESDDSSGWKTVDEGVVHTPFYVEDETGKVLVEPHDDATYDLEPEDWSNVYVDSANRGPGPVQQFVEWNEDLSYPSDAGGKENDRKYQQNLIRDGESVYVFGTTHPRDDADSAASNAERLKIRKTDENSSLSEPMYMISDDDEKSLINRRAWALWRAPVGGFFMIGAFATLLILYAPLLGLSTPILY